MDLFVEPAAEGDDEGAGKPGGQEQDELPEDAPAHQAGRRRPRFAARPACVREVNKLLCVRAYAQRWPRVPKHELLASSVEHPRCTGWRWLLHTRRVPAVQTADAAQPPPWVKVCWDCGHALSAESPKGIRMPKYALANDNWIGRMPLPYRPDDELLSKMEFQSLARGRACVKKVIAEPEKGGARGEAGWPARKHRCFPASADP